MLARTSRYMIRAVEESATCSNPVESHFSTDKAEGTARARSSSFSGVLQRWAEMRLLRLCLVIAATYGALSHTYLVHAQVPPPGQEPPAAPPQAPPPGQQAPAAPPQAPPAGQQP